MRLRTLAKRARTVANELHEFSGHEVRGKSMLSCEHCYWLISVNIYMSTWKKRRLKLRMRRLVCRNGPSGCATVLKGTFASFKWLMFAWFCICSLFIHILASQQTLGLKKPMGLASLWQMFELLFRTWKRQLRCSLTSLIETTPITLLHPVTCQPGGWRLHRIHQGILECLETPSNP